MKRPLSYRWPGTAAFLLAAASAPVCIGQTPEITFRTEVRVVEVYATVTDQRGRFIDDIPQDRFRVTDNGLPQKLAAFENTAGVLSCAILLDTTGSMTNSFPIVRNAILRLMDELRESDWVAVYTFSTSVELIHDFSHDVAASKQAVLRTRAGGRTALYDSISRVAGDAAERKGKKAVVVFTDGEDNASVLNIQNVVERARKAGVPLYMVAQGDALRKPELFKQLQRLADLTGGKAYAAKDSSVVPVIFHDISEELQHTYLLAYPAPATKDDAWRSIQLSISGLAHYKIHAKEGYFPF